MTIKVRYSDFTTITRSQSLPNRPPMPTTSPLARSELLEKTEAGHRPVRLLGVSVHNFGDVSEDEAGSEADSRLPF